MYGTYEPIGWERPRPESRTEAPTVQERCDRIAAILWGPGVEIATACGARGRLMRRPFVADGKVCVELDGKTYVFE